MSGGVGPTAGSGDILLPGDECDQLSRPAPHTPHRRFLSFRQLNALAVVVVVAASGMVSAPDLAFVIFSFPYLYFLSAAAFPPLAGAAADSPDLGGDSLLVAAYVYAGAAVGILLPVAYIVDGVLAGDKEGIKAAAPHVFLLAAQMFLEGVTFTRRFSPPMRAFVPVFYNTRRLFAIADWIESEVGKAEGEHGAPRRLLAGRALALVNMAFWGFNLFGFLLPVNLPRALKGYYCRSRDDTAATSKQKAVPPKKIK